MSLTSVDTQVARIVGRDLVGEFRRVASEIHFLACRDVSKDLIINDNVLLVNSLGLGKGGRLIFREKNGVVIELPERWGVRDIQSSGALVLQNIETGEFKLTEPYDRIVKAGELFYNDGEIRGAILQELKGRSVLARRNMKTALEKVTGFVTSFANGRSIPGSEYSPRTHPRNATDYILFNYLDALVEGVTDPLKKDSLRAALFGLERKQLDLVISSGGADKYRNPGLLPRITDIFTVRENPRDIYEFDGILLPGSLNQFIALFVNKRDDIDVSLCTLEFDRTGVFPGLVIKAEKPLRLSPVEILRTFFEEDLTPRDEKYRALAEMEALGKLKEMKRISKFDREESIRNYNRVRQAEFERSMLVPLLEAFKKAHPRRSNKR